MSAMCDRVALIFWYPPTMNQSEFTSISTDWLALRGTVRSIVHLFENTQVIKYKWKTNLLRYKSITLQDALPKTSKKYVKKAQCIVPFLVSTQLQCRHWSTFSRKRLFMVLCLETTLLASLVLALNLWRLSFNPNPLDKCIFSLRDCQYRTERAQRNALWLFANHMFATYSVHSAHYCFW